MWANPTGLLRRESQALIVPNRNTRDFIAAAVIVRANCSLPGSVVSIGVQWSASHTTRSEAHVCWASGVGRGCVETRMRCSSRRLLCTPHCRVACIPLPYAVAR